MRLDNCDLKIDKKCSREGRICVVCERDEQGVKRGIPIYNLTNQVISNSIDTIVLSIGSVHHYPSNKKENTGSKIKDTSITNGTKK